MCVCECSVVSNSLWPWTIACQLLCPWSFPGKNTRMGCHFLLQGISLIQELNPHLLPQQADSLSLPHLGSQTICMSFPKCLFTSFAHFWTEFFFLLLRCLSHFYVLDINPFWDVYFQFANTFSHFVGCLSTMCQPVALGFICYNTKALNFSSFSFNCYCSAFSFAL